MTRNQTIAVFLLLASSVGVLCLSLHVFLHGASVAFVIDVAASFAVVACAIGCFVPNSSIFGAVTYGRGVRAPVIALTFDDGPSPDTTPRILDVLHDAGARATFFVLGKHAVHQPELVERMVREGHEVASHGWSHDILAFARPAKIHREITETARVLARAGAPTPTLLRAPHGFRGPHLNHIAAGLGYHLVGWTKGVFDTARPGADVIAARAASAIRPGAILLLHDADGNGNADRSQTADALPAILASMQAQGLAAVTVSQLADMEPAPTFSWWRAAVVVSLLVTTLSFVVYRLGFGSLDSTIEVFAGVNLGLVAAAVLANVVSVAFKAVVWKEAIDIVPAVPRVRFRHVVAAIFVGFLVNSAFVARTGEVARAVVLRRRIARDGGGSISMATLVGTIVMETVILAATLLLILGIMVIAVPDTPPQVATGTIVLLGLLGLCVIALGVIAVAQRHAKILDPEQFSGWLGRRFGGAVRDLHQGHLLLANWRRTAVALLAGVASWGSNLAAIWLTLLAFGMNQHALGAAVLVFAVSNLIGLVQITPGNVAVFQVAIAIALSQAYGVDQTSGLSFGIGLQAIEVSLGAGLGILFLLWEGLTLAEVRSETSRLAGLDANSPITNQSPAGR